MSNIIFGLNRIMAPKQDLESFFKLTSDAGLKYLEVRNDQPSENIYDGYLPKDVLELSKKYGVAVYTVNALQQFNRKKDLEAKSSELAELSELASKGGCKAIILCPVNDPEDGRADDEQLQDTITALDLYGPIFEATDMTGLIEPLGFDICSIRTKEKAVKAIEASKFSSQYKIVHDTFHHFLADEKKYFPQYTGLVHISGVEDKINKNKITDDNRVFIGVKDIMNNLQQIKDLLAGGYDGVFSFEPFGSKVQNLSLEELKAEILKSMELVKAAL